jgi:NTE family protein
MADERTHADGPPRTALVLSGGGASGAVEVGFYKALWEFGVQLDLVIGSSVGAINGAMIAAGLDPDQIHQRWRQTRAKDFLQVNWLELLVKRFRAPSLFKPERMRAFLERGIPARRFEDLTIPFVAVATDLLTGEPVGLEGGDLIAAVQASCAIPAIFPPIQIGGRQYADGGLSRQIPVDFAIERGAKVTIVGLSECRNDAREPVHGWLYALGRGFSVAVNRAARTPGYLELFSLRTRLIVLEPCFTIPIAPRHLFDLENTDIQVKFGYEYAKVRLEQEGFAPPSRNPAKTA